MIIVKQADRFVEVKFHTFSGGEEHVNVNLSNNPTNKATIFARIDSSSELMRLLLVTDALKRQDVTDITLEMPYIPYARQDRVCAPGDSFSLKLFADLINQQNYKKIFVADSHSMVATALLNNVMEYRQSDLAELVATKASDSYRYIVAPDAGASKKAVEFAKAYSRITPVDVVQALKVRDPVTGNITKTTVLKEDFVEENVLIVDDIADGAASFLNLAVILKERGAGKIGLFVTHGIFSRGLDVVFDSGIDSVYTTDSFDQSDSRVKIIHKFFPDL